MTTVVPGPGLPPSGTPATSPAAPAAGPIGTAPEQPSSAGGDGPSHPSGIFAITDASTYDDEPGADRGSTGTNEVIADLGTTA
jgi:hypothetical protein